MEYNFDSKIMTLKKALEKAYSKKNNVAMKRAKIMAMSGAARNSHDGYVEHLIRLGILKLYDKRGGREIYTIHLDLLRGYTPKGIAPPQEIL